MTVLLFLATCFLAYSNGANDNFKGVASLFGSRTTSYRTAIGWATVTTFGGSVCAIFLAQALLKAFSGKGLVPDSIVSSAPFLLAVALGAGMTVIVATRLGFPVSTTHALIGAIVGGGLMASGTHVNFGSLGRSFFLPLLLSPFLAAILAAAFYMFFRFLRIRLGISKEWCVCVGEVEQFVPIFQPASVVALQATAGPVLDIHAGSMAECTERYAGHFLGLESEKVMDGLHFLSSKNPLVRSFHALAYTFVDRSDSGHNRVAIANFVGAGASGFVGNLYLPAGFNNLSHAETRTAFAFGRFAAQNLLREFIPDLLKATHKLHAPFPRIPVPEWWVKLPAQ